MAIWTYSSQNPRPREGDATASWCIYCGRAQLLKNIYRETDKYSNRNRELNVCSECGWWNASHRWSSLLLDEDGDTRFNLEGITAILRVMDMVDVSQPIEDVRSYLLVRYESRKEMHPRLFELTVSDVFKDFGYKAEATAYGKDGGVDVVLVGPNDATVAIQVKRYRAAIEVENIRAFAGAMVLRGYTKGIFVTTSRFQSGAATAVEGYMDKGIGIELVDSERFFQMLRMKRRNPFLDYEAWASEFGELSDFEMGNIYKSATGRNP